MRRRRAPPPAPWGRHRQRRAAPPSRRRRAHRGASCGDDRSRRARPRTATSGSTSATAGDERRTIAHERRLDLRLRQEDRRRHPADDLGARPVRDLHRDRAVALVADTRGQALPDLALHHHEHPGRSAGRRRADRRRAESRRCREGSRRASSRRRRAARGQSILSASASTTRDADRLDHCAQHRHEAAVDLDRGDVRAGLRAARASATRGPRRSRPRDHRRPTSAKPGDAAHRVGVDDEVLPERAARVESVRGQQLGDVPSAERHQVMRTLMMPAPTGAISTNCSSSRSMIALPYGPRSFTMHHVDAPVFTFTTVTTVPFGQGAVRAGTLAPLRIGVVVAMEGAPPVLHVHRDRRVARIHRRARRRRRRGRRGVEHGRGRQRRRGRGRLGLRSRGRLRLHGGRRLRRRRRGRRCDSCRGGARRRRAGSARPVSASSITRTGEVVLATERHRPAVRRRPRGRRS